MPKMTNPETLRGKLRQARETGDYWRKRAEIAERELRIAAKCVRSFLQARTSMAKWLDAIERAQKER